MGAARTLARKSLMDQSRRLENKPAKKGTRHKRVHLIAEATRWFPFELTFHATKGHRRRRIPYAELFQRDRERAALARVG